MFNNQGLKAFFSFSRKDRIFILLVATVVGGSLFLPRFMATSTPSFTTLEDSVLVLAMDTLQQRQSRKNTIEKEDFGRAYQYERTAGKSFTQGELFLFDPNVITVEEWQRLGLNARTSKTIANYIQKGGRFRKAEDLKKIWGMPAGFYDRVKEYVRISVPKNPSPYEENRPAFVREERKVSVIDINKADSADFIALPGIGSKLSARILSFRDKLGGFYAVEQVAETYGLPDSTFQKIKGRLQVDENNVRKINVNTATKEELKTHPYIRWNIANAIVEYRNQHGAFEHLDELKNIMLINEDTFRKIAPYLVL